MNKVRESFRELLNKLSPAQLEEVAAIAYEIKKERESSSKVVGLWISPAGVVMIRGISLV